MRRRIRYPLGLTSDCLMLFDQTVIIRLRFGLELNNFLVSSRLTSYLPSEVAFGFTDKERGSCWDQLGSYPDRLSS